jgi:hypothetical protein
MMEHSRTSRVALAILILLLALSVPRVGFTQQASISGSFSAIWGDGPPGTGLTDLRYFLTDDLGVTYQLLVAPGVLEAAGGIVPLNRQRVSVAAAVRAPSGPLSGPAAPVLQVTSLSLEGSARSAQGAQPYRVTGSVPWVTILCKFADVSAEPKTPTYIDGLMGAARPGLDFYWRELSFDNINIVGSTTVGWVTLPRNRSYYVYDIGGDGDIDFDFTRATNDCTALADPSVHFPNFSGIQMLFNDHLDGFAWGGSRTLDLDGQRKYYSTTWYPPWGYNNQSVIGHEMGHGLGLPHSSGPYSATYDSEWDVMSDAWVCGPNYDSTYRCLGQHTISYHKNMLGWIPAGKNMVVAAGTQATFLLDRLGMPTGDGYLMATIPILGTSNYYTVERREFVGFDLAVPAEAVVIHEVNPYRSRPANVVDPDNNGNPNDAGSYWVPGEQWTDETGTIHVLVHSVEIFIGDALLPAPPGPDVGLGLGFGIGPAWPGSPSAGPRAATGAPALPRFLVTIINGS